MYLPRHFAEPRLDIMHALMRDHPLCTLITTNADGIAGMPNANAIPMYLIEDQGEFGVLRGHVARANPVWQEHPKELDVLAVFQGPDSYVSPSFYPSKQEHGKVVPTWNYATVHAWGKLHAIEDPIWLRALLDQLTERHESEVGSQWKITDAPNDYIAQMLNNIVGIEIVITKISGKWKVSQNRSAADQAGVLEGLRTANNADKNKAMVKLVVQRNAPKNNLPG
ncbi:FMN-binding negative transcriptional regulator [Sapientia aquatica]|uniref:FMN-binding negative transcriptional regulator n=1 Tax=Sapientia aquatica TaxID=1549640 RepID=A0A4R5W5I5_9BURK|nr:FMN-binding negative transcriptional regulator [Sapientia aquatica]TDK68190.1 FMN-binding negative transcriptional regulator [Sapientia aquatica]